jgi:Zn-dependent peptidase ImmA (M78 family)
LGFAVVEHEFPEEISAVTFIEEGVRAIGVNEDHPPVRRRFSVAHELGHFLNGPEPFDHSTTHVDTRPSYLNPHNRQEREADEFAAELLMPLPWLKQDVSVFGLDVPALARRYEVSEQAMWIQLIDHKLASQHAKP